MYHFSKRRSSLREEGGGHRAADPPSSHVLSESVAAAAAADNKNWVTWSLCQRGCGLCYCFARLETNSGAVLHLLSVARENKSLTVWKCLMLRKYNRTWPPRGDQQTWRGWSSDCNADREEDAFRHAAAAGLSREEVWTRPFCQTLSIMASCLKRSIWVENMSEQRQITGDAQTSH